MRKRSKKVIRQLPKFILGGLVVAGLVAMIPVSLRYNNEPTSVITKAADTEPELRITPEAIPFTTPQNVKIMMDTRGQSIVFADIQLSYNSQYIKLNGTPIPSPVFGRLVENTPISAANATGSARITVAVNPNQPAANGFVEVATLPIRINTGSLRACSELRINPLVTTLVKENGETTTTTVRVASVCYPTP